MMRKVAILLLMTLMLACTLNEKVFAQTDTDVIKEYAIVIVPQDDGTLLNTYTLNWCVISNTAEPFTFIRLGMPNSDYEIGSFSGDVLDAKPANEGAYSQIRIDLVREVNADDCANITIEIHQLNMAHLDSDKSEVGFQFIPSWFDEIPVEHLKITWQLPADQTLLKQFDPLPSSQDETSAVWEKSLQPGEKYPIIVLYDQAAFPNLGKERTPLWTGPAGDTSTEIVSGNIANEPAALPAALSSISLGTCVCVLIVFIVLIVIFVSLVSGAGRGGYQRGGYFGGYHGGGGWGGSSGGGGGGILGGSAPSRSGGGGGLFGGRGSSCACVSCVCACACAGGGRAGCSRKGFDISTLIMNSNEKSEE